MRNLIITLIAALLPSMALAQVRTEDIVVPLFDASTDVTDSAEKLSKVVGNSSEIKTLGWSLDATDAAFTGTVKVYQSNHKDGPFTQWTTKVSGTSSPTITMSRKHLGNTLTAPSSLFMKAGVNNANGSPSTINFLDGLRRKASSANPTSAAVDVETAVPVFPAGTIFVNGDPETLSEPIQSPGQLKSIDWDLGTAGSTSNVTLTLYVSQRKDGPYTRWTPSGTTTQFTLGNKEQGTDMANPDAAWCKVGIENDSGGDLTVTRMTALRRSQRSR